MEEPKSRRADVIFITVIGFAMLIGLCDATYLAFGLAPGKTVARLGAIRMMMLARPCASSQAEMLAEALRFSVAEKPLSERISATVSIGVAQLRIGESVDELLARTERVLHVAKQFGRDRVEVASAPPSRIERAKVVGLYD